MADSLPTAEAIAEMAFEEALAWLDQVVRELEGGQVPLDRALELYERGLALRDRCRERLSAAEGVLQKLREGADGSPLVEDVP